MRIFTKEYWFRSAKELKNIRHLAFAALICALTVALDGLVKIPLLPGGLEIKFTFVFIALGCAVYGPVTGMLIAVVVDTLSFLIFPTGYAYFPGYMLTEMLVSLIYGLFFYRQKITVWKLAAAKICTNYLCHVGLNALWSSILLSKGYLFYLGSSLVKNTLLLPIEVLIMAVFFALTIPPFAKMGLLPAHSEKELQKLTFRRKNG